VHAREILIKEGGDMAISLFINFNGNCREAVLFYADIFNRPTPEFMTFADAPPDPDYKVTEKNAGLIMFSSLNIEGINLMFSDIPEGWPLKVGNNISITLVLKDQDEVRRLFGRMAEEGEVTMPLQETFWSKCYGNVTDKYGIQWQFSHESGE